MNYGEHPQAVPSDRAMIYTTEVVSGTFKDGFERELNERIANWEGQRVEIQFSTAGGVGAGPCYSALVIVYKEQQS